MPTIQESQLVQFSTALFRAAGVGDAEAKIVAESLVQANLRGHDSHGVMRVPFYIGKVQDGSLNPSAQLTIEKESPCSIVADGGWGLGQVLNILAPVLIDLAAELQRVTRSGGTLVLAGLVHDQLDRVCIAFDRSVVVTTTADGPWRCVVLRRPVA